jgi:hypothetical protein
MAKDDLYVHMREEFQDQGMTPLEILSPPIFWVTYTNSKKSKWDWKEYLADNI